MKIAPPIPDEIGTELSRFPLHHAVPLTIFRAGNDGRAMDIKNGTLSLIKCKGRKFGITNYHVYEEFLKGHPTLHTRIFFGSKDFTGKLTLIDFSAHHDLVTFDLDSVSEADISSIGDIPTSFFSISSFSTVTVKEGDWLTLGGYPGRESREKESEFDFSYYGFSYGGSEVVSVSDARIYARFDIDSCVKVGRKANGPVPDLGGLSGCPAFVPREGNLGILFYEFAGIFYEFGDGLQVAKLKPAALINDDGKIVSSSA